ncbi:hypothetical protein [Streptomyces lonarensis]|uniref:Uncharacterized protein n=1 Tax=Streptomyces lonarensis TaxID=700599 RepID=A0A7X6HXF3_9ACTN|nr:hypothetical protein [Streptomyces lonarensis]NJQ04305.1 hypothetical protein [Streptomyces lonarensis]
MTTCETCGGEYKATDPRAVERHTAPVDCGGTCRRCQGKPWCYPCGNSFCHCDGGH